MQIHVEVNATGLGRSASTLVGERLRAALAERGRASILLSAAPSQDPMLRKLFTVEDVDWSRVDAYHVDDYVGLTAGARQSFAQWLRTRIADSGVRFHALVSAAEPAKEIRRYTETLRAEGTVDVSCLGIGVNGHLAFNEPDQCDFSDAEDVRLIDLDRTSRQQQVDEGLFETLDMVPASALTLTVPRVLNSRMCVVSVLGPAKAAATVAALTGPVTVACPASALQTHDDVVVFLDEAAASGLPVTQPVAGDGADRG